MDAVQAILLFVIVLLTVLLIILGVQAFFVLRSLKTTILRANKVLENTEFITSSVSEPISLLSSILVGKKTIPMLLKFLGLGKRKEEESS